MLLIDLGCYVGLLWLLFVLTRVKSLSKVRLRVDGRDHDGAILICNYGLGTRIGLFNTPALANGDGLLLVGAKAITTKGMHYAIDIIFLDESSRVIGIQKDVQPGQNSIKGPRGTRSTLELGGGTIAARLPHLELHAHLEFLPC